jgi:hypothetical protein
MIIIPTFKELTYIVVIAIPIVSPPSIHWVQDPLAIPTLHGLNSSCEFCITFMVHAFLIHIG